MFNSCRDAANYNFVSSRFRDESDYKNGLIAYLILEQFMWLLENLDILTQR